MKTALVVTHAFGDHAKGDHITDPKAMAHADEHHHAHVVRIQLLDDVDLERKRLAAQKRARKGQAKAPPAAKPASDQADA